MRCQRAVPTFERLTHRADGPRSESAEHSPSDPGQHQLEHARSERAEAHPVRARRTSAKRAVRSRPPAAARTPHRRRYRRHHPDRRCRGAGARDRHLARTGCPAQQTAVPDHTNNPGNRPLRPAAPRSRLRFAWLFRRREGQQPADPVPPHPYDDRRCQRVLTSGSAEVPRRRESRSPACRSRRPTDARRSRLPRARPDPACRRRGIARHVGGGSTRRRCRRCRRVVRPWARGRRLR